MGAITIEETLVLVRPEHVKLWGHLRTLGQPGGRTGMEAQHKPESQVDTDCPHRYGCHM